MWYGVLAPAGTPAAIIQRMNEAINVILQDPATATAFDAQGMVPATSTPAEFGALVAKDAQRWDDVITRTGISAD